MDTETTLALTTLALTGAGTAFGWLVNSHLESKRLKLEAQQKFLERQIEELYGPLSVTIYEGRRTFLDLLDSL